MSKTIEHFAIEEARVRYPNSSLPGRDSRTHRPKIKSHRRTEDRARHAREEAFQDGRNVSSDGVLKALK